jgi:molybdenum cofactor cytidylyltransferase
VKIGAVVVAAGLSTRMNGFKPMLKLSDTTIIKKTVDTLQQAGASPVVIVTGYRGELLERHLSRMNVVCLKNELFRETQMLDSVKLGLRYIQAKCDRVLFTPGDVPLFSLDTVRAVAEGKGPIVVPTFQEQWGHPIAFDVEMIPLILDHVGKGGLRGALETAGKLISHIPVDDRGIMMDADTREEYESLLQYERELRNMEDLHCNVQVRIARERDFFGPGVASFLLLTDQTGSMQMACKEMGMSYSKAWKMINEMEVQLGYSVLERYAGGAEGGGSCLTEEGREFVRKYQALQSDIKEVAETLFQKHFGEREEPDD